MAFGETENYLSDRFDRFEQFREFLLQGPITIDRLRNLVTKFGISIKQNGITKGRAQLVDDLFLNPDAVFHILRNLEYE